MTANMLKNKNMFCCVQCERVNKTFQNFYIILSHCTALPARPVLRETFAYPNNKRVIWLPGINL